MKFIVQWTPRPGNDPENNLDSTESLLRAFGGWTPPEAWTIDEFVARVDARSGLFIIETDDITSIDMAVGQFQAWFDFDVYPVVDVADSVSTLIEATAWARSAGGFD